MNDKEEPTSSVPTDKHAPNDQDPESGTAQATALPLNLSPTQAPFAGVFLSALVLFVAVMVGGSSLTNYGYAVAVSVIAMVFSAVGGAMSTSSESLADQAKYITYFLLVWCVVGTCVLTFNGPFEITGNGYFAAWAMTVFAIQALADKRGLSRDEITNTVKGAGPIVGLGVGALIVLIAASQSDFHGFRRGSRIYSLILSCVTIPIVAFSLVPADMVISGTKVPSLKLNIIITGILAVCWILQASIATFHGPFLLTGNGYFGSWGSAVASVFAAMEFRNVV